MRVTLMHIAVDGNWTISRALRQESDDIIEVGGEHLRPYVELIAGAEPALSDDPDLADLAQARPLANGHAASATGSYQPMPTASGNHAPPSIYTAPVVAEYQRPSLQLPRVAAPDRSREDRPAREDRPPREDRSSREDRGAPAAVNGDAQPQAQPQPRQDIYAAPSSVPTAARPRPERQESAPPSPAVRAWAAEDASVFAPGLPGAPEPVTGLAGVPGPGPGPGPETAAPQGGGQVRRLPSRSGGQGPMGAMGASGVTMPQPGQHAGPGQGSPRNSPFSGPQPVVTSPPPGYVPVGGISLSEAVQAAHEEGQEFGGSVARDAPALWLEAVLARKPRMPSDLEARLLQGSALPIDYLLHDEVRHALRRGFWDALERTRR
jgi:hypothetical protein